MTEPITPDEFAALHYQEDEAAYRVCHAAYLREREMLVAVRDWLRRQLPIEGDESTQSVIDDISELLDQAARKEGV